HHRQERLVKGGALESFELSCSPRLHNHWPISWPGFRLHDCHLVSVAEWESLQETLDILADPGMRADLVEAAAAEARGDVTTEEEMAAIMAARLGKASA
ncbi:hypothetical protein ABZ860_04035, partial [Microbispora sp. NPDC046973]